MTAREAYDQLVADGARADVIYRFKIQGIFKSLPPDSTVVRKFWKWQRRHKAKSEIRVIDVEAPPAEAAPAAPVEAVTFTEVAPEAPVEAAPPGK